MALPPGPTYIAKHLPILVAPSIIVYLSLHLAKFGFELPLPTWVIFLATVFALPARSFLQWRYADFQDRRTAAALGAELAPRVPDSAITVARKALHSNVVGFPCELMLAWSEEYGNSYYIDRFTSRVLVSQDPNVVKAVLATQFDSFEKGHEFTGQMRSLLGTGIFNTDGDMWKFHRGITRPFFTRERISDFDIYDRNCEIALNITQERLRNGEPVEFQDLVGRFTLDSATEFLFGHNVESLSAGIPYPPSSSHKSSASFTMHPSNTFVNAFTAGQLHAVSRTALGTEWPLFEFWKDRVAPLRKAMDNFTVPLVVQALEKREEDSKREKQGEKVEEEETLLAHLVRHTQDQNVIKDELVNLLVAGRDTTTCLLTFSMYMLAEHPDIERRLRQEVMEKVGPTARPTYESMRDTKFMRAFLNEVLRLYPSVPANVRRTNKAIVLPSHDPSKKPMYIPADTGILYGVINIQRRADLWGPTALQFDPDRFLDERQQKYLTPNPFIFCPFNAGPRICLGQQFAYHEATFFLVRLIQRFTGFRLDHETNISPPKEWATGSGTKPREKVHAMSHLTMFVKGGLWVYMDELTSED